MSGKLVAEITSIVRQHLSEAHNLLGELLTKLDQSAPAVNLFHGEINGAAATEEVSLPARPVTPRTKAATVERKARRQRAQQRHIAGAANGAITATGWPALRQRLRAAIANSGLSYASVAPQIQCRPSTLATWLSRDLPAPSPTSQRRLSGWLQQAEAAAEAPATPAEIAAAGSEDGLTPFRLTDLERDRLNGFLSLSDDRSLRSEFGMTRPLLEKAAAGSRINAEAVARLRTALANGAGAE